MRERRKRLLGGLALALGACGATFMWRRGRGEKRQQPEAATGRHRRDTSADRWARPGMAITFRAELMPSRARAERTYRVAKLLPSGRVLLDGVVGEHTQHEFEPVR